ncbi:transposase [Actinosynnema sp. NPDC059797]
MAALEPGRVEDYPEIEAGSKSGSAAIAWADQCVLRSDAADAPPGRPWESRGRTPIVRVTGKRLQINVMSAVASRGALCSAVSTERFTAAVFTDFLDRIAHEARRVLRRGQYRPYSVRSR